MSEKKSIGNMHEMNHQQKRNPYEDIIHLPHPTSRKHPRMPVIDRAAQFSPFAALTGHEAALKETARLTERRIELDENARAVLDEKLQMILEMLEEQPEVCITYFVPDEKKDGGTYVSYTGAVRKIDGYEWDVIMMDGTRIKIREIIGIEGALFHREYE